MANHMARLGSGAHVAQSRFFFFPATVSVITTDLEFFKASVACTAESGRKESTLLYIYAEDAEPSSPPDSFRFEECSAPSVAAPAETAVHTATRLVNILRI